MANPAILQRIHAILEAYELPDGEEPYFTKIYPGHPLTLPPMDKLCAYWWERREESTVGPGTMHSNAYTYVVRVKCFWLQSPIEEAVDNRELDVFVIQEDLPEEFQQDATLAALVTPPVRIGSVMGDAIDRFPETERARTTRTFEFEILLENLDGGTRHA